VRAPPTGFVVGSHDTAQALLQVRGDVVSHPNLRVVVDNTGAARRPVTRAWMLWVVAGCALAYIVGYAVYARLLGGK
jgi:hypothetical protein